MSENAVGSFRTLAFGDLDDGVWGAAWLGAEPCVFAAVGKLGPEAPASSVRAELSGSSPDEDWRLVGDTLDLTVSAHGEAVRSPQLDAFDQLCQVRGRLVLDGAEQTVDALGRRGLRSGVDFGRLDSVRDLSAWFAPDDGIAVTALRPRRAGGQDGDVVVASVFESTGAFEVADPRLSTTYSANGSPSRAGVELWLDVGEEGEEQYPRRAAGEALGAGVVAVHDGLNIEAHAFRWHSHGYDGTGVYMLARPR